MDRYKIIEIIPLIGFNQISLFGVSEIYPSAETIAVKEFPIMCIRTHAQTDFVSLYISTYITVQHTMIIQPKKSVLILDVDVK